MTYFFTFLNEQVRAQWGFDWVLGTVKGQLTGFLASAVVIILLSAVLWMACGDGADVGDDVEDDVLNSGPFQKLLAAVW